MARARNIKPGFYKNEDLAECSVWARLLFPGLWMLADRDGRLEDRPKRIKGEIFPFDTVDVGPLLDELEHWKFIARYEKGGARYIQILNFSKHQRPHVREKVSEIPPPDGYEAPELSDTDSDEAQPRHNLGSVEAQPRQCRARSDSLIPESSKPLTTFGGAGGAQAQHEPEPPTASPLAPPTVGDESAFADQPLQSNEPKRSRGTRLTASWFLPKAWGEWALAEKPSWTPEHVRKVSDRFRDHWIAAAGRTGVKLDWEATWRNWVRKEPELNGARASPYGQRRNFLAESGILGDGT